MELNRGDKAWLRSQAIAVRKAITSSQRVIVVDRDGYHGIVPKAWLTFADPASIQADRPSARNTDPDTSKAPAHSPTCNWGTHNHQMLKAWAKAPPEGWDDWEAFEASDCQSRCHWKRSSDLRYLGLIEDTGVRRKGTSGASRMVCSITYSGEIRLRDLEQDPRNQS